MREVDHINSILNNFKRAPQQKNKPFESDSEIIDVNGTCYAITMDEFSGEEDLFDDADLPKLGRNLATATISDLFATGCAPQFYMHSIVTPIDNTDFASSISKGIHNILNQCGAFLIGGDMGQSDKWRYTGVALGIFNDNDPINRIIPEKEQSLWVTGTLGDFNLSAYVDSLTPEIECRLDEANKIKQHANACIDTSGGFMDSLWTLKNLNPHLNFYINSENVPFDNSVVSFCSSNQFPKEAFLFGGAGEYELLFTTDKDVELQNATKIGTILPSENSKIFWNDKEIKASPPDAREFDDRKDYVLSVLETTKQCL